MTKPRPSSLTRDVLRREPQQARAQRRIDLMLDAAAALIAESGVAEATTNAIAARAGASVGSLYQFFPDKHAVLRALAQRYAREFDALKDRIMSVEAADLPLPVMMRNIVEPMAAFFDGNPAYMRVYASVMDTDRDDRPGDALMHHAVIARVEAMLQRRYPSLPSVRRQAIATVQVHAVHAVMMASLHAPAVARHAQREELIRTLVAALEQLDDAADDHRT